MEGEYIGLHTGPFGIGVDTAQKVCSSILLHLDNELLLCQKSLLFD